MNISIPDPQSQVMVTPSDLLEYLYCPRFIYFQNVMNIAQYEDRRFKVRKGRQVHEDRLRRNKDYLRKKLSVVQKEMNVYLADPEVGFRGIVDEILYLDDGSLVPVDYKYTPYREKAFKTHTFQIIVYGVLIEKIYSKPVSKGYIAYIRGGSKISEIDITANRKHQVLEMRDKILAIIQYEKLPKPTRYKIRCRDCTYKNICV